MDFWNRLSDNKKKSEKDLQIIRKEIDKLTKPQDIPKKVEMLQHALSLVQRQSNPARWAALHGELGTNLAQNSQGNRNDNIEKAIKHYNQTLEIYTLKDFPVEWAMTMNNLGNVYSDRVLGGRAENIEESIEHYNQALKVRKHEDFPVDWAMTMNNLGNAYWSRILGNRAENIEKAIEHYEQALEVRTTLDFPVDWAETQNNLANGYWSRILGERADNIEKAIEHYYQSLEVRTPHDFPVEWATTQNNLGNAYSDRILGERADNIEKAIECYNQALKVRTYQDFPVGWAMTQNNLAAAYLSRIKGDKADNIEQAIEHYNQALKVYNPHDFPVEWALTQNNLGNGYWRRILGDRADNIEKAIECYNQALKVRKHKDFPVDWAMTQNNIGNAYSDRVIGNRTENIEKAIEHYNKALEVRTQEGSPLDWATTQNNLSAAYLSRILGGRGDNIEKGIEHYNQALEVYTFRDFPVDWAMIQNNLANSYWNRILGKKIGNIEKAIEHCHRALKIYTLESMPSDFCNSRRLLGDLYLDLSQWKKAMENYKEAIKAGDLLYRASLSAESKTVEVKENARIYRNASFAACRLGLIEEALLILELGKTRLLSEALRLKMKNPEGVPKEKWGKYEDAAEKYRTATKLSSWNNSAQREEKAQEALNELNNAVKIIQRYNQEFQKELEISDILSIVDNETALLTFCIADKGSMGFVVTESNGIQSVDISGFKTEDLNSLLFKSGEQGITQSGWIGDYLNYFNAPDIKRYDAFKFWLKTLDYVLSNIRTNLLEPLLVELPPQIKRLILLPSGGLFLLPLHAIPLSDGKLLCQRYCISYAPSVQLLKEMQTKAGKTEGKGLYAVINPEEDPSLVFSIFEGQAISELLLSPQMNIGKTGTRATVLDRVSGHAYLHFSCHGSYNWNDPSQSGLHLFGGRTLSLADLQNDIVDMSSARLVTLSACETGITDIAKSSADEFVGLPAGFMLAGVPCIVSSLWSVPEISTALLMERFYSNHIKRKMDISMALQEAQLWVRDLTSIKVADYVEKCYSSGKWKGKSIELIEKYREHYLKLAEKSPEEKPFQHPYYWAAFTVNGA